MHAATVRAATGAAACVVGGLSVAALGRSVTLTVTHDDPDGVVAPGETVRVTARFERTPGLSFLGILAGDLVASPDIGEASGVAWPVFDVGPILTLGAASNGSVRGLDAAFSPPFFITPPPAQTLEAYDFLRFDWTAPSVVTPTEVAFEFDLMLSQSATSGSSQVHMYLGATSVSPVPVPTTTVGTSLVVLPGVGTGAVGAGAVVVTAFGRRRRGLFAR